MDNNDFQLSEIQLDLLKELFNLGVGGAANSLSQLANQEVLLSVPTLIVETPEQLANRLGNKDVISVSQEMDGPFAMNSLIVFHPEDSFGVVKQMLNQHLSDETLAEMQSEALTEIGNIVLNACIGVISEALDESFSIDLPIFKDTHANNLVSHAVDRKKDLPLSILVKIELKINSINGHLVFILNTDSMNSLRKTLDSMLEKFC